ncbi:MBL fold metallo-hydrolase [Hydrogenophaga sp. BPS33]|uniref:MBL fold metallo-hydrolase n=1 Tax=Hydrogenophaga sp. BPS33 TaxID=2651974 RepID=UPI0013205625|nr:MBL fold metallo-hydrolase [Hydrogenophaga sp. BPS33]QHE87090.1 MBL fold metallo-hydrolase [Hydrogenophaga sp. BPS33]
MQPLHDAPSPTRPTPSPIGPWLWTRRDALPPLRYHAARIEIGVPHEIAEGVFLLRLPLPFALKHINVYLLPEADGWSVVDTGIDTEASRAVWERVFQHPRFAGRTLRRIVVTHHHPDHIGLAGWLAERCGAPVLMTRGELEVAGRYADPARDVVAERTPLWNEHGLPADVAQGLYRHMPRYGVQVCALPAQVADIDPTRPLALGERWWTPVIGQGHSPDHLSLLRDDGQVLIGGDQVLPEITPNIAVWPGGDQNPLRSYLASLQRFEGFDASTLLLPSHRQPAYGIATRVDEIRAHHEERLLTLLQACERPMTGYEFLPTLFGRALRHEEIGFGLGEAIAHLNFLEDEGLLASSLDSHGCRRFMRT